MRVLIVTELWPPHGGSFVFDQVKALAPFVAISVVVLVAQPPKLLCYRNHLSYFGGKTGGQELEHDIPVYYVHYRTIPELSRYLSSVKAFHALRRFLLHQQERFDIIHAHFAYIAGFAAVCAGQRFHIPTIITVHGSDINYYTRRTLRNLVAALYTIAGLRCATAIIAVGKDLKNKVSKLGVPSNRIIVVPDGIEQSVFFPRGEKRILREQLRLPQEELLFLYVGNFTRVKSLDTLLNAFARIRVRIPHATLVMVGDGELETELKQYATVLGIIERIIWAGRMPHKEIPYWMSAADFLVLPSLNEGYGLVILEALACGIPAIASQVGGILDILVSPDLGIMFSPGDSVALANAMFVAIDKTWNPNTLVNFAHANTWAVRVKDILQLYQNITQRD